MEGDNRGRVIARYGTFELRPVALPETEPTERDTEAEDVDPQKTPAPASDGTGTKDTRSPVGRILQEFKTDGRGLAGVPDTIYRDLMIGIPYAIMDRFEQEEIPGGLQGLSATNRNATIAIVLAQHPLTRSLKSQDLLTIFTTLPLADLEQRAESGHTPVPEKPRSLAMVSPPSEVLSNVGRRHPYQGKPMNEISRMLREEVIQAVNKNHPKGKFGPIPLTLDEQNALIAIVLARLDATKDLNLPDLLSLYHEYRLAE